MLQIQFKKLHKNAVIPKPATAGAACADLVATEIIVDSHRQAIVQLGFATAIPFGYKAVIVPRSSFTGFNWVLQNSPAQIDSDYRGEWMLKFRVLLNTDLTGNNVYISEFPYKVGDRVAQVYFEKVQEYAINIVDELTTTERDDGGFGSTGM